MNPCWDSPFSAGNLRLDASLAKAMAICLKECMLFLLLLLPSLLPLFFPCLLTNTFLTSFSVFRWLAFIACLYYCLVSFSFGSCPLPLKSLSRTFPLPHLMAMSCLIQPHSVHLYSWVHESAQGWNFWGGQILPNAVTLGGIESQRTYGI